MRTYKKVEVEDVNYFQTILDNKQIIQEELENYGSDHTEDYNFPPELVLLPYNTEQVSQIMNYCNEHNICVTPIGALTGLSGGALSINGGVGLSLSKMNKIIKVDKDNLQVITEPGVITQELQEEVMKFDLHYAPDPSSRGSCFIGGNVAENAGGARAVKYGVTKDWVLNLKAVLPNGEIIQTGANTLKNSTGYNLTQLLVGSEGTLAVITEITLKLIPLPKYNVTMLAPFKNPYKACEAVAAIFQGGITPSALEFLERDALEWSKKYTNATIEIPDEVNAHLLIEVDGNYQDTLYRDAEKITEILEKHEVGDILFADDEAQKNELWRVRRTIGEAVKSNSIYKEEDTVVPRFELPNLLKKVKDLGEKYGFKSICYGHAGDGNLHINIIKGDLSDDKWKNELPKAITELFEYTVSVGGTLSGEHGIGYVQKNYMPIAFTNTELALMKSIKKTFDPKGILNPNKIFND